MPQVGQILVELDDFSGAIISFPDGYYTLKAWGALPVTTWYDSGMDCSRSIYYHIPFCVKRCQYCDFVTYAGQEKWIPAYFSAMENETRIAGIKAANKTPILSVYFGGGTPSLAQPDYYASLLKVVSEHFQMDSGAEITLEANPGTVREKDLQAFRLAGINRVSLGVQSFRDEELRLLGRIHAAADAEGSVMALRQAGFKNLSLDLIFGLPGQSLSDWRHNMQAAVKLNPEHLSLYCLTIENGTPLESLVANGSLTAIDDDLAADMYLAAIEFLRRSGYRQYEISNWARVDSSGNDYSGRHNSHYWKNAEYFGFGAGAHGYTGQMRVANTPDIQDYISAYQSEQIHPEKAIVFRETIANDEVLKDEMMLGLRMVAEGVSRNQFIIKYRLDPREVFRRQIDKLVKQNLLEVLQINGDEVYRLTARGIPLANRVFMEFVGEDV